MTDSPSLLTPEQARVARILLAEQATKLKTLNDAAQRAYKDRLPPNIEFEVNQRAVQIEALTIILTSLDRVTAIPVETIEPAPATEPTPDRAPTARRAGKVKG